MDDKRQKYIDLAGSALIAAVLGTAITMILSSALMIAAPFGTVLLACLLVALTCALSLTSRVGSVTAIVIGVITVAWLSFGGRALSGVPGMLRSLLQGSMGADFALTEYAVATAVSLGTLLTLVLFWMARMGGGVYPALTLSLILLIGSWFMEKTIHSGYTAMAVAALATMFARAADEKISYLRAVPAGVVAALLALMLLPSGNVTWKPLEDMAQKARNLFSDYFLFTDPRTTYSISSDGFQSMGEVLGGPAQPSTADVMAVETDRTLLLRGSIKRTYTTYSWVESAVNSRYVFIDPMRTGLRNEVFDVGRPEAIGGALTQVQADVTMLGEGISALFVPHRLSELRAPIDLVTYFSSSGEVFITRSVQAGDQYGLTALVDAGDVARTRAMVASAAGRGDRQYQAALSNYTALPQGVEQGVYQLAQQITQTAAAPYDKALAIQDYLMTRGTYTLDVPYPPPGRDFVSAFLLDGMQGYCSYFASAMAVMGRMAGLPTRYIEGYLVPARAGGETIVTGKNAHAWVEVYFDGVGWLAFNPTPGSGDSYQPPEGGGDDGSGQDSQDEGEGGNVEPTPTPAPEGEEEEETATQPEEQAGDESQDEPESEPEPEPEPEPQVEDTEWPEESSGGADRALNWLWLLLLLPLAALAWLAYRRYVGSDPRAMTGGRAKPDEKLMVWYRAILLVLEQQGQSPTPGETPTQFAQRLAAAKLADDALCAVARQVTLSRYAGQKSETAALRQARTAYDQLAKQLKPMERVRWVAYRMAKGLGDVKNIP